MATISTGWQHGNYQQPVAAGRGRPRKGRPLHLREQGNGLTGYWPSAV